eukprot:2595798-Rhodomonas_salina.4
MRPSTPVLAPALEVQCGERGCLQSSCVYQQAVAGDTRCSGSGLRAAEPWPATRTGLRNRTSNYSHQQHPAGFPPNSGLLAL